MTAAPADEWRPLDGAYAAYLDAYPQPAGGSLLAQTILTGPSRRQSLLPLLGAPSGSPSGAALLDLGTGFGAVVLEAAHRYPVHGTGLDSDPEVLAAARSIVGSLSGWLHPEASVRFEEGTVAALPFEGGSFDVVVARLLFQHLPDPIGAVAEIHRVLRPGGRAVVFDVDDGLSLTYPAPASKVVALELAFDLNQASHGGDREVGRKLTTYFHDAGFDIASVQLLAQAEHRSTAPGDASRQMNAARLRNVRAEIVGRRLLGAEQFDEYLAAYEQAPPAARFRAESQVVVVAEKPRS